MDSQEDGTILAIMEFLHFFDSQVNVERIISGNSFCYLFKSVAEFNNFQSSLNINTTKWSAKVTNLSTILQKIEEFFEVKGKGIFTDDIDLTNLCKNQSNNEIKKYFEVVIAAVMDAENKQTFIQKIMSLPEESQEHFVEIIKNALEKRISSEHKTKQDRLAKVIYELQDEKMLMEKEIQRLCRANNELLLKVKEYEDQLSQSLSQKSQEMSFEDHDSQFKYYEEYIDKLTKKLLDNENEKEEIMFRLMENEEKITKYDELDELCKIYKDKYDEIMDQFSRMNIWSKEKSKMQKIIEEKEFTVRKLQDRIDELVQKNLYLEELQMNLKLEDEKKNLRLKKIQSEMKKSIVDQSYGNSLDLSMKENTSPLFDEEDEKNELKKNYQKLQKQYRNMAKQIAKLEKKSEKVRLLEEDKKKLQILLLEVKSSYEKQINILVATLEEVYHQSSTKMKNMQKYTLFQ